MSFKFDDGMILSPNPGPMVFSKRPSLDPAPQYEVTIPAGIGDFCVESTCGKLKGVMEIQVCGKDRILTRVAMWERVAE